MRRKKRLKYGATILSLFISVSVCGQNLRTPTTPKELEHTIWAYSVQNASSGAQLVAVRAHQLMTPASTMKLVSTGTALSMKGGEYRFMTTVATDGEIVDSVLKGNLYVLGSGDPSIGSRFFFGEDPEYFFKQVSRRLKDSGITRIEGSVIGRAPLEDFQAVNPHWPAYDMGNHYASGVYELNAYDNSYNLQISRHGKDFNIDPKVPGLRLTAMYALDDARSRDSLYISPFPLEDGSYPITGVYPSMANNRTVKGAVPNPPLFVASLMTDILERNGISIAHEPSTVAVAPTNMRTLYTFSSPTLNELILITNTFSHNLFAEGMLRLVGNGAVGEPGFNRTQTSIAALRKYWDARGLDIQELEMVDGSGLSPEDKVSPYFLTSLLGEIYRESSTRQFINLLPRAGLEGTLVYFLKKTPLQGKAHLKSGTIRNVVCYAGYVTHGGKVYAVALMVNNYYGKTSDIRKGMEKILLETFGLN